MWRLNREAARLRIRSDRPLSPIGARLQSYSIYLLPSRPLGRSHWDVSPTDSGDRCCSRHRPRLRSCPAWCRRHRWQRLLALLPLRFFFSAFGRKAAVHCRPGQMVLWGHVRQGVPEEEGRMDSGVGNPACNPPSIGSQSSPHRSPQSLKRESGRMYGRVERGAVSVRISAAKMKTMYIY